MGVFDAYLDKIYKHNFKATIVVDRLVGGIPADDNIIEGWYKTKVKHRDDLVREKIMEEMLSNQLDNAAAGQDIDPNALKDAVEKAAKMKGLNVFWRDHNGLYLEGRCAKACLKEAANVAWPNKTWGTKISTKTGEAIGKQTKSWFPEHVFVLEKRIHLNRQVEDDVMTRFVTSRYGTSISQEAYLDEVELSFTVCTDYDFTTAQWAELWLRAQNLGIGSSRSQGYGTFEVVAWDPIKNKNIARAQAEEKVVIAANGAPKEEVDVLL